MRWAFILLAVASTSAQTTPKMDDSTAGYRFRYFVKDEKTGDIKGQTEVRQGDNVRGSYAVAEPNGNTRIVTYTAGKDTGFNARVQVNPGNPPSGPLPPTNEPPLPLSHLMKIPPRNIYRTGFQPVEIKVVPPSTTEMPQVTQKPPFTPEEEHALRGQELPSAGYSEQHLEIFNPPPAGKIESGSAIHHETSSSTEATVSSTTGQDELCPTACDNGEQGRARIKQEGDKVQLEMEQVIRTEMKDPEGVKMGQPYAAMPPPQLRPNGIPPLPLSQFRPDVMTPIYMKPLYLRTASGTNAAQWPPIVAAGNRLYIPHIVVNEDSSPEVFPSKVYLVPIPRPLQLSQEELMSLANPWDGKMTAPKEEPSLPSYRPTRPLPRPTLAYPPAFTYLLLPKDIRGK